MDVSMEPSTNIIERYIEIIAPSGWVVDGRIVPVLLPPPLKIGRPKELRLTASITVDCPRVSKHTDNDKVSIYKDCETGPLLAHLVTEGFPVGVINNVVDPDLLEFFSMCGGRPQKNNIA